MTLIRVVCSKVRYVSGAILLLIFAVLSIFGTLLYPHGTPMDPTNLYAPASWSHPFGTDFAGRDILGMVVLGTRPVIVVAVLAGIITLFVGTLVGLLSAYVGGILDTVLMRLTDFILALPSYPIMIVLAAVLHVSGALPMAALLSVTAWAGLGRAIRSQVLSTKKQEYIEAARSLEIGHWRIAIGEMLPSLMPYIMMHLIMAVTAAVYGEVGLYFLGAVPVNSANWGVMLNWAFNVSGAIYTPQSALFLVAPLLAITLLQTGAVLFNQALEEYFNPNLRTSA
ncbi:ABC transporter permease [Alicyclobacillus fastidiosus]|uniref:ABC transporter permease n=1 Tax=Alicyclobacillus fastidiosus TaxID=392011 RepID=A0ABY6ZED8_9BACL|nr:ABC transporter permease [Alicyclobacillus fastidiosus]WAH40505.1 ABC transporter permease [Alicyclobacillus fastidiosus]GMA61922.1 peptide ABC transporter permease [Alicyclobacillus fastidiosus]